MKQTALLALFLVVVAAVPCRAADDIAILPANRATPSEAYYRFVTGFLDGYFESGRQYRVRLSDGGDESRIPVIREEGGGFVLHRGGVKLPLAVPEKKQVSLWLQQLVRDKKPVLIAFDPTYQKSELLAYTRGQLAKKGVPYRELATGADIYRSVAAFFSKTPAQRFGLFIFLSGSDFAALQFVNKLRVIRSDADVCVLYRVMTQRFFSNLTVYDGLYAVVPLFGREAEDLFEERYFSPDKLDVRHLMGFSLGSTFPGDGDIAPDPVLIRGSARRFRPVRPAELPLAGSPR